MLHYFTSLTLSRYRKCRAKCDVKHTYIELTWRMDWSRVTFRGPTIRSKVDGLCFDSIFTDRSVHGPPPLQTIFPVVGAVVLSGGVRAFRRSRVVWSKWPWAAITGTTPEQKRMSRWLTKLYFWKFKNEPVYRIKIQKRKKRGRRVAASHLRTCFRYSLPWPNWITSPMLGTWGVVFIRQSFYLF